MKDTKGIVFNIQHYSIHDGPGVRTNVFLKGCPLRCQWCANPESQIRRPQLMVLTDRCNGCGACVNVCTVEAISLKDGKAITDRGKCTTCGACFQVCASELRSLMGKQMRAVEVVNEVLEDQLFMENSGGGVTLTGGEVLAQPDFAEELLLLCKENGVHTAVETCGQAPWNVIEQVLRHVDLILYDCKHMDPEQHQWGTGVSNEHILDNLVKISQLLNKKIWVRVPLISGYNDSEDNIRNMVSFIREFVPTCEEIHLLPYHNLGEGKKSQLEWTTGFYQGKAPESNQIEKLKKIIKEFGFKAVG